MDELNSQRIVFQILQGLLIYHSNKIEHGFINFDNIFISENNFILSDLYESDINAFKSP